MDRISTATKAVDLFGAGKHGFKDGDLALGIVPTDLNAELFNGLQEEVLAVIEAAGLVPAAATRNQLLLALRAAGVLTTPAQFDNTTKAATTAYVKAKGVEASAINVVTATGGLPASYAGSTVLANAASAITITLPAANAVPQGARIEFLNINTGVMTVQRGIADTIKLNSAAASTSVPVGNGDTLTLESDGAAVWYAVAGSAQVGSSAAFGFSAGTSGYQKLPNGIIVQWGVGTSSAGGTATQTLPIAYPTVFYIATISASIASQAVFATTEGVTLSSFNFGAWTTASARVAVSCQWVSFGK